METITGHLYDYPKYYDLIFGTDWKAEYRFLEGCFSHYARRPVSRIFEPGCGTGRLLVKFAEAGYEVSGNDLNERAIEFCNQRLERAGYESTAFVGDMSTFSVKKKFDAAFNMINTFRHLHSEPAAVSHLRCVADAVSRGGLYVLGLHLTPQTPPRCTDETWKASRGSLAVVSRLWSIGVDLRRRQERIGMTFDVFTPSRQFRIREETVFRTYTCEQLLELLAMVPQWQLEATYDFRYDLSWPIDIGCDTEDVVLVLRRK